MKKIYCLKRKALFLLLIMLAGMAKAQYSSDREYEWDDLTTENRVWIQMYRSDYDDTTYYQLGLKGDTMVNGVEYKKLIECSHIGFPIEGQCVGGIRTDGTGKYYFVSLPPFSSSVGSMEICMDDQNQEVLLYDFSLSIWDEWQEPCYETMHDDVIAVYEEEFCGITRKVLKFSDGFQWIWGVGCDEGLLYPIHEEILLCGIAHRTVEVFQDGESIYKNPEFEGIDYTFVGERHNPKNGIALFPNPAKDKIFLLYSPDTKPTQIQLYDQQGHLVRTQSKAFESIDISQLLTGTYMIRVTLEDGKVYSDKVVKE